MIEIEGVWKQYKLGNTVDLQRSFRETITEKLSLNSKPRQSLNDELFWALKDINLSVPEGKTLGLIGHNGAGKSTLLKVLSRITKPTKGRIKFAGKLSSLLEVGTGFHPELSGRENVFLYGSIMGMSKRDIHQRFDEIVSYAGIEQFIDTPVKRYSSGMHVRLAFSVAAHVEPDILIVDEVLAVGDKSFREKCLGKMDDVAQSGRTVVFVSHNMKSIASLCKEVAWLDEGSIREKGDAKTIIQNYENSFNILNQEEIGAKLMQGPLAKQLKLKAIAVNGSLDGYATQVDGGHEIDIDVSWQWAGDTEMPNIDVTLSIFHEGIRLMSLDDRNFHLSVGEREFTSSFRLPRQLFLSGDLSLALGASDSATKSWCWAKEIRKVSISSDDQSGDGEGANVLYPTGTVTRNIQA